MPANEERDGPRFPPHGRTLVYVAIADDITDKITDGTYPPESRLPSEAELAEEYGAAKMTVRAAIRVLNERGLVETVRGKGSFVLPPGNDSP